MFLKLHAVVIIWVTLAANVFFCQFRLFPWQPGCNSSLSPNPTNSDIQTGRPDWDLRLLIFVFLSPERVSLLFSRRSVYWLDKLPPERTASTTKVGTVHVSLFFLVQACSLLLLCFLTASLISLFLLLPTELTPRWSDLCKTKKFDTQVT